MTQGILPFKYENYLQNNKLTGFGGPPAYLDLAQAIWLPKSISRNLNVTSESQGWTDSQVVIALILLNLVGGDCVEDLNCLENDEGDPSPSYKFACESIGTIPGSFCKITEESSVSWVDYKCPSKDRLACHTINGLNVLFELIIFSKADHLDCFKIRWWIRET